MDFTESSRSRERLHGAATLECLNLPILPQQLMGGADAVGTYPRSTKKKFPNLQALGMML